MSDGEKELRLDIGYAVRFKDADGSYQYMLHRRTHQLEFCDTLSGAKALQKTIRPLESWIELMCAACGLTDIEYVEDVQTSRCWDVEEVSGFDLRVNPVYNEDDEGEGSNRRLICRGCKEEYAVPLDLELNFDGGSANG